MTRMPVHLQDHYIHESIPPEKRYTNQRTLSARLIGYIVTDQVIEIDYKDGPGIWIRDGSWAGCAWYPLRALIGCAIRGELGFSWEPAPSRRSADA